MQGVGAYLVRQSKERHDFAGCGVIEGRKVWNHRGGDGQEKLNTRSKSHDSWPDMDRPTERRTS